MEDLTIFIAELDLKHIQLQLQRTLDEIKQKHSERTEYITAMTEAVDKLNNARVTFSALKQEYLLIQKRNIDLEIISLKALNEIKRKNATL